MKRPFWMHQLVEYILGIGLIAQGAQSTEPAMPCLFGLLILINAAAVDGPLSAFDLIPRQAHRIADFVVAALMIVGGVLLGGRMESASQFMVIGIGAVLAFIAWRTNYARRVKKTPGPDGRADDFGRMAGRLAASGVKAYRRKKG